MTTRAIVPVKGLAYAKSRLRSDTTERERAELVLWMLRRVLVAITSSGVVEDVVVVTPDASVARVAREAPVRVAVEPARGLNVAVGQMLDLASQDGFDGALVVLADLPCITAADVAAVLQLGSEPPCGVLVPDRRAEGTNLLYISPPDLVRPLFGIRSFEAHRQALTRRSASLRVYRSPGTQFDVDTPQDLAQLTAHIGRAAATPPLAWSEAVAGAPDA